MIKDGTLWLSIEVEQPNTGSFQLILPFSLREGVLEDLHSGAIGGHLGEEKMIGYLKERFYWPGCAEDVREWCKTCGSCATRKSTAPRGRAPLQGLQAGYPMQIVAVDIMGPLSETSNGNRYVFVASDYFTCWIETYGIPNQGAVTVAEKLVGEMFCRFSPPDQLHSDQGKQLESNLIAEICALLQIKNKNESDIIISTAKKKDRKSRIDFTSDLTLTY